MKAIQFRSFGGPEVLEYVDLPTPSTDPPSFGVPGPWRFKWLNSTCHRRNTAVERGL